MLEEHLGAYADGKPEARKKILEDCLKAVEKGRLESNKLTTDLDSMREFWAYMAKVSVRPWATLSACSPQHRRYSPGSATRS